MIGGIARMSSASTTLALPTPRNAMPIESTARLGSARPIFATLTARNEPRCTCPSQSPIGSATAIAIATATAAIAMSSTDLCQRRPAVSPMNWKAWTKVIRSCPPQPRPRRDQPLGQQEQGIGGQRGRPRKAAAGGQLGGEGHEQLEQREAGDRVEESGEVAERPLEPAVPVGEESARQ